MANHRLRLEPLEDRMLLSAVSGSGLLDGPGLLSNSVATGASTISYSPTVSLAPLAAAAATQGSYHASFITKIPLTESTTPNWKGYDIDARSLPANAIINQIVLHHAVTHPRVSDLQVKLYNDSGTEWMIRKNTGGWVVNFNEYATDNKVFVGAPAAQIFHYRVADTVVNGKIGSIKSMELWINYTIPASPSDLTVTAAHTGNFTQGQTGATFTINVKNNGTGPTSGTVNVKDILPAGLTATAMSGVGWTTNLGTLTATRSDALAAGASYAPLIVTVNVAADAPTSVVNTVQVTGGNDSNAANNTANDTISIMPALVPDLTVTAAHTGNFTQGQTGATYTINVTNLGNGATSGIVSVKDILPTGLTATAMSGVGWTTNLATLTATRSDTLAAGASYAPLLVTVNVAADAPTSVVNTVQVTGGNDSNAANNTANDTTNILPLSSAPKLVDANLSVSRARDGQTITVGYQISSAAATSLLLNCMIVGPDGIAVQDAANTVAVNVAAGTNWYTRSFVLNLPPTSTPSAYTVTWTVHNDATGDSSVVRTGALTVDAPIDVRVPILMYHNVATTPYDYWTTTIPQFTAQMRALKAYGYTAVTMQDVLDYRAGIKTPPAKPVVITFDDGYESLLNIVLPILADPTIDFKATAFISTVGIRPDNVPGGYPTDPLSWPQVRELNASGRIDIQSHTVNHDDLTTLNATTLAAELTNSKNILQQQLGGNKQINFIAYPYGASNATVEMAVWKAGYSAGLRVDDMVEMTSADKFALERVQMDRETSVELDQSGWYEFFISKIGDSSVAIPDLSVTEIQCLDPVTKNPISQVKRGQTVLIKVNVKNYGDLASVIATLSLDSDSNHNNGVIYNSHTVTPKQDVQLTCPWGTTTPFQWTWTVPSDAPTGQYYLNVSFNDPKYVLIFKTASWQSAFQVMSASLMNNVVQAAAVQPALVASDTAAAHDAAFEQTVSNAGASISTMPMKLEQILVQPLAQRIQAVRQVHAAGQSMDRLAALHDAVLTNEFENRGLREAEKFPT